MCSANIHSTPRDDSGATARPRKSQASGLGWPAGAVDGDLVHDLLGDVPELAMADLREVPERRERLRPVVLPGHHRTQTSDASG